MNPRFETGRKGRKRRPGGLLALVRAAFNAALLLAAAGLLLLAGTYVYALERYGEGISRRYPTLPEDSYVYDAGGERIATLPAAQRRVTVAYRELGPYLPRAVVAVEDRRFYEHAGVDPEGVLRAAWADLRAWRVEEGGSTITEQLVKNLYIPREDRFKVSFWRRLLQACLAHAYEREHTKREILTAYLNAVYFGRGAYGAEAAARAYFGKSAEELSLSEAAALAGFLHAPSYYGRGGEERAEERRDAVLRLMRGQGMISEDRYRRAISQDLRFAAPEGPGQESLHEPFLELVRREVREELGGEALRRGGLRIRTTLDPDLQRLAAASAAENLYAPGDPSAAVVSVEPQSGAIRALWGKEGDFNLALDARRQPGSAFKPVVLAAALEEGISPFSTYLSGGLDLEFRGERYVINNYGYAERGEISLADAMAVSDNTVFVRLALDVGLEEVVRTARELGIESPVEPYPSTAIGGLGVGVSPLEMASAYATFAGGGVYREPYAVRSVRRVAYGEGEELYGHPISGRRVLGGNQAAAVTDVLRGVVERGTASRYRDLGAELGRPSAGKTGTSDGFADAWYVGYTPRLSTAVWVGYPEGRRSMAGVHGIEEVGGETLPLDIWADYMREAVRGEPVWYFRESDYGRFRVVDRGYAEPAAGSLAALESRIRGMVDEALREAFGG
ncbi:Penicillin-binding protein 2D [Rubrobacter xylanophilus DSM 9941]|uniref:transglycosylase domain-containing protein n=1 Tax=Rubrobacter xylanophilus TaxID=49319 RepID=UPI001C63F047|nr:transglycosylase domain-containing protein [Rubrobacter xylanophilus]QYJ14350.1 Penicillin-binding protein 2D [Rubrobacter xylanophilus DSM 9941]